MNFFKTNPTITTTATQTRRVLAGEFALMKRKKKSLIILILLFICMLTWAVVSIFSSQKSSKIDPETKTLAEPLNPIINAEIFSTLEKKRSFTEAELEDFVIYIHVKDSKTGDVSTVPISGTKTNDTPISN